MAAVRNSTALRIAALLGFLAVALGAFGAHSLKDLLARNGTAAIWEKAVFYHFIHAVMLFLLATRQPLPRCPWLSAISTAIHVSPGASATAPVADVGHLPLRR